MIRPIRVLVVHRSALLRKHLANGLARDPGIQVVGTALSAHTARDRIIESSPDVMLLGTDLPEIDGVKFLQRLMPQHPIPVVILGDPSERGEAMTIQALEAGAVDFVTWPALDEAQDVDAILPELRTKIKIALTANVAHWKERRQVTAAATAVASPACQPAAPSAGVVIAIGASTGGTEAIRGILLQMPQDTPGIVVVQHMPAAFTKMFANRLNHDCLLEVKEAEDGDGVRPGLVLIAPGNLHMRVVTSGQGFRVRVEDGVLVTGHRPSVDVLMRSVAERVGRNAIGVMLTGMGRDGVNGMKAMRDKGARTLAQDERTSVVFGMPKEAFANGAAEMLVPLDQIPAVVTRFLGEIRAWKS